MKTIKDIEYSFNHTRDRLKERYNLSLSRSEYDYLCGIIRYGKLISREIQKNDTQEVYEINLSGDTLNKGTLLKAVWSMKRNCITTILPIKL